MTNAKQLEDRSQVMSSIVEEIEMYKDAIHQVELKNQEYRPPIIRQSSATYSPS
jgi:hypothetical protein